MQSNREQLKQSIKNLPRMTAEVVDAETAVCIAYRVGWHAHRDDWDISEATMAEFLREAVREYQSRYRSVPFEFWYTHNWCNAVDAFVDALTEFVRRYPQFFEESQRRAENADRYYYNTGGKGTVQTMLATMNFKPLYL